jgi:hypothetical protein
MTRDFLSPFGREQPVQKRKFTGAFADLAPNRSSDRHGSATDVGFLGPLLFLSS